MAKNGKKIIVIALLLLLTICLYFVAGTYAKYTASATASAELGVANWTVKIGEIDISGGAKDFSSELSLETDSASKVAAGKIAPDTTASGTFTIDPNGTEVAVKYSISIGNITYSGTEAAPNMTITKVMAGAQELTVKDGTYSGNIALNGQPVDITVTATWTSGDNDSAVGHEHGTLTVPVTVTVEQDV